MDKESKIFFVFIGLLTILSIGVSFYRYVVLKDIIFFKENDNVPSVIDGFENNLNSWKI